ncbi:hypothetical protein ACQJBY_057005 [Aegilops geniculata]
MGVKGGGVVVWCLLLAGLLLLAVASAAERDTEKEEEIRLCKKVCDWKAGQDTGKARECKEQCERRRHGHELLQEDGDSFDRCVSKCRGHGGWWGKERWERCRQICRQSQEGEGGDDDLDVGGHNADDRCERMCQRYHDRREKKQCMKGCRYGESDLLALDDDGHEHGDPLPNTVQALPARVIRQAAMRREVPVPAEGGRGGDEPPWRRRPRPRRPLRSTVQALPARVVRQVAVH